MLPGTQGIRRGWGASIPAHLPARPLLPALGPQTRKLGGRGWRRAPSPQVPSSRRLGERAGGTWVSCSATRRGRPAPALVL